MSGGTFNEHHILGIPSDDVDITFGYDGSVLRPKLNDDLTDTGELYLQEEGRVATCEDIDAIAAEMRERVDAWVERAKAVIRKGAP